MISQVLNVGRWEWFKLRRRWIAWILLGLLLAFSQLAVWGNLYSYHNLKAEGAVVRFGIAEQSSGRVSCNDLRAGNLPNALKTADATVVPSLLAQCDQPATSQDLQQRLNAAYQNFTAPGSLVYILQKSQVFIVLLASILTASLVGAEYGLGTLRPALASGTGRWQYLAGKLLLMVLAVAAALAILTAATYGASVGAKALESVSPGGPAASSWSDVWRAFGKDWFALLPDVAPTTFVTVLVGSTASGLAIGLGYYFAELALVAIFSPFTWFDNVANYLLGRAMAGWNGGGIFNPGGITVPSDIQSILVLTVYTLILGGAAFWLFIRRDVTGAVGS